MPPLHHCLPPLSSEQLRQTTLREEQQKVIPALVSTCILIRCSEHKLGKFTLAFGTHSYVLYLPVVYYSLI